MTINKKIILNTITKELDWNMEELQNSISKIDKIYGCKYPMIDAHIHAVDFTQRTQWLKYLLIQMDKSNVVWSVIFGLPVIKTWSQNEPSRPEYYLDDDNECYYYSNTDNILAREYLSLSKQEQKKFFPLICWFNPMDINCVEHIINTYKTFPWVFCWVWEVFYRHDDLTHLTPWEVPTMNTKAWYKLLEFVSEYDLPLLIHNNITSPWINDYPKFLHELEVMLREFPKAKVVLAHAWASRRLKAPYYTKMLSRLLTQYPSLYIDFSWVIFDDFIAVNDTVMSDWIDLTVKFSNRIMIWSDALWNAFHEVWLLNSKFNIFLSKLDDVSRENVCINTAKKLYSTSKNKVEKNIKITYPNLF